MKLEPDEAKYQQLGLDYEATEKVAIFTLPADPLAPNGPRETVAVALVGGQLEFFPERSVKQKRLMLLLGAD